MFENDFLICCFSSSFFPSCLCWILFFLLSFSLAMSVVHYFYHSLMKSMAFIAAPLSNHTKIARFRCLLGCVKVRGYLLWLLLGLCQCKQRIPFHYIPYATCWLGGMQAFFLLMEFLFQQVHEQIRQKKKSVGVCQDKLWGIHLFSFFPFCWVFLGVLTTVEFAWLLYLPLLLHLVCWICCCFSWMSWYQMRVAAALIGASLILLLHLRIL